jgi:hypothetical protein
VNRLELQVRQGGAHQHRQGVLTVVASVDELLQLPHAVLHQSRRRRHEPGVSRPGAADPVLATPELPRQAIGAATTGQQPAMDLAQQGRR